MKNKFYIFELKINSIIIRIKFLVKETLFKYLKKFSKLPFFAHNDFKANLIFVLGIILFLVVLEDLEKEFATEKDEIGFFVTTLTGSIDSVNLGLISTTLFVPPLIGFQYIQNIIFTNTQKFDFPTGRSPPLS